MKANAERTDILWVKIKPANMKFIREEMRRLKYKRKTFYVDALLDEIREKRARKSK
jgi:hypothetical protein